MVFDIVDAKFAVYEEMGSPAMEPSFQMLPTHLTTKSGKGPKSVMVAVHVDLPQATTTIDVDTVPKALQSSLFTLVKAAVPPALEPYSSLYRWSGEDAQPEHHPLIRTDVRCAWMELLSLYDADWQVL